MSELREALEAAFDEEPKEEESVEEVQETPEEPSEEPSAEKVDDGEDTGESESGPGEEASGGQSETDPTPDVPNAPVGWDAGLREKWGGLPDDVRRHVLEREQQIAQAMQGTAEARRTHQELGRLGQTYGAVMAAEGVQHPLQAVDGLFQTAAALRLGNQEQKAQKIAEMIQHYGVDIATLDNVLVGEAPPEHAQFEKMLDERMQPVNQMMGQLAGMQQQRNYAQDQGIEAEVNEFAKNAEFLNDVRGDMADLIDLATRQGRQMTLQDAYDKAIALNPQIQTVLQQRAQAAAAKKKAAASSLAARGPGAVPNRENLSLREQLNASWDELAG